MLFLVSQVLLLLCRPLFKEEKITFSEPDEILFWNGHVRTDSSLQKPDTASGKRNGLWFFIGLVYVIVYVCSNLIQGDSDWEMPTPSSPRSPVNPTVEGDGERAFPPEVDDEWLAFLEGRRCHLDVFIRNSWKKEGSMYQENHLFQELLK